LPANTAPNAQAAEVFTVRHAVINMLRELGMTRIFGNPGSTELPCFATIPRTSPTSSACRKPWSWAWQTAMPRPRAMPAS
jgi:hypothetical protein